MKTGKPGVFVKSYQFQEKQWFGSASNNAVNRNFK